MTSVRRPSKAAPRIHLASLGCAKNLVDSEKLLARLATAGALVGAAAEDADILLVNTCGFIDPARRESLAVIAEAAALKARRPDVRLFVLGCLVVRDGEELRRSLPAVDAFFGLDAHEEIVRACGLADEETGDTRLLLTPSHTAYLRVSEGCNHRCSYCTIPLIRGPFRSRSFDDIVVEAESLARLGVRELNLIGQDTAGYGTDRPGAPGIVDLLERLDEVDGIEWIRLLYAHPIHVDDQLVRSFARVRRLVPYVDLPLQHLSDRLLAAMNRRVGRAAIDELLARLRSEIPGLTVRTTFIVGFPGETESEFDELVEGLETHRFDHVGAFAYSPERDTPAAELPGRLPADVVGDRLERLYAIQRAIVREKNARRTGEIVDVLVDGTAATRGWVIGRTAGQAPDVDPVTLIRGRADAGSFVRARIDGAEDLDLVASIVR